MSTTVVENGIDVPNANTILIFHCDRSVSLYVLVLIMKELIR